MLWQRVISSKRLSLMDAESGAALVEFTLFAPILLAIAVYTMDFGLLFFTKVEVQNAAQAGAQYAIVANDSNSTNISNAVTRATNFTAVRAHLMAVLGLSSIDRGNVLLGQLRNVQHRDL
jgi:Flp pilus assembly protein TadG